MRQAIPFGPWLRARRNALDLTQRELAQRVACSSETIEKLEGGTRRPSKQVAALLAGALLIAPEEREAFLSFARSGSSLQSFASVPAAADINPAAAGADPSIGNLPAQPTSFVGRKAEVKAVTGLLRRAGVRLLTLSGPPGIGKTRLGLRVAAGLAPHLRDGVAFVPLASTADPARVPPAIVRALNMRPDPDRSAVDCLISYLRDKEILLLLDNFEQIVESAPLVSELLLAAPGLKVLVTSRILLKLYGEHHFPVPPLAVPGTNTPLPVDEVSRYEAIQLFEERAIAAKYDFRVFDDNAPLITQICRRLDGLPLSIELAAARSEQLTPPELLAGLERRLDLLANGPRDLPERQRTLRGAIAWSYDLLAPAEQELFRSVSCFTGGCTIAAAEAVCGAATSLPPPEIREKLESLVTKSLLRRDAGSGGEARYTMLPTIRDYALELADAKGETHALQCAHASHFVTLAEEVAAQLQGPNRAAQLACLDAELDNLRAAIMWGLHGTREQQDRSTQAAGATEARRSGEDEDERADEGAVLAARISSAIWNFMWTHGYLGEGRQWLEASLAHPSLPASLRASTLRAAGILANDQGDYARAYSCFQEALEIMRNLGDERGIGLSLNSLGVMSHRRGDYDQAGRFYLESLEVFRKLQDETRVGIALNNLGAVAERQGNYEQARAHYAQSLHLAQSVGDREGIAWALDNLGNIAALQEDPATAWVLHLQSLELFEDMGDRQGIAVCLEHLAGIISLTSDQGASAPDCGPAPVNGAGHGVPAYSPDACRAARLFGAAEALREATGAVIHPSNKETYQRRVRRTLEQLGADLFAQEWEAGRRMGQREALAYARETRPQTQA